MNVSKILIYINYEAFNINGHLYTEQDLKEQAGKNKERLLLFANVMKLEINKPEHIENDWVERIK